jgi:hypothetical protein
MQGDWLTQRVTLLEQRMERLEALPGDVSGLRHDVNAQFVAVRHETATEFTAVREEMATGFAAVREEMATGFAAVRGEMAMEFAAVRGEMDVRFDGVEQVLISLQSQILENHRHMLVLHEDVRSIIATLGKGLPRSKPRKKR